MSGFKSDLSSIQKEALDLFNEYLNKSETIQEIKDLINQSETTETIETTETTEPILKIWDIDLSKSSTQRDVILLKFLRAREFKIEVSKQMLIDCLIWRETFNVENIINEEFPDYYKSIGETYKTDKEGRPVMINYYSNIKPEIVFKDGVDQFLRWKVQQMEIAISKTLIPSQWEIEDLVVIHDYKDCSFFKMDPKIKQASNQVIQTFQNNYPEFLAKKLFIRIPWMLEKLVSFFTFFTNERTKSKFIFCSNNYREKLLQIMEPTSITPKLEGFEDTQLPVENLQLKPHKSHAIQLGELDSNNTIDWEFTTSGIDQDIYAVILYNPRNQSSTSNDLLYYNNNNTNSLTSFSNDDFTLFHKTTKKEFNSGSIQLENDGYYTLVFNNPLNKDIDLYYRITIKSITSHSSTTTASTENLL